jgi:predicted nuclease with TOPRIM domain
LTDISNALQRNSHSRTSSEATSVDPTETIDRFLELEDQNHELRDDLDFHEGNIKDLKRRMTEIETQMKEELQAVELIIAQREERDLEKKRLWDTMSKEEIRELGRRDSMTKRPKHG